LHLTGSLLSDRKSAVSQTRLILLMNRSPFNLSPSLIECGRNPAENRAHQGIGVGKMNLVP
jgi:hypothetical protein